MASEKLKRKLISLVYRLLPKLAFALFLFFAQAIIVANSEKQEIKAATVDFRIAVFGDSNSTNFVTTPWVTNLASSINPNGQNINYIITNYSVGGTTMTQQVGVNSFRDTSGFTTWLANPNLKADLAIVMLGVNDAYSQIPTATFTTNTQSFTQILFNSQKVGNVLFLSVPPMTTPWNCAGGGCPVYTAGNNPDVNWIQPYNTWLSANVTSYCNTLNAGRAPGVPPMNCSYINTYSSIPKNSTYISAGDGIHLLAPAQTVIQNAVQSNLTSTYATRTITVVDPGVDIINRDTNQGLEPGGDGGVSRFTNARVRELGVGVVADITLDLSANRSWTTLTVDTDLAAGKSVVANLTTQPGAAATHTLYIPKIGGHGAVRICPSATTLAQVTLVCSGGYTLTTSSPYLSSTTVSGQQYWTVSNMTGTGGVGIPLNNTAALTLTPNSVPASTVTEVTASYTPTVEYSIGESIIIDFSPATLSGLCASPTTDADGSGGNDGSGSIVSSNYYVYTFTSATTLASSTGVDFCVEYSAPAFPSAYNVWFQDDVGHYGQALEYVGDGNDVQISATVSAAFSFVIRNSTDTADIPTDPSGANLCSLGMLSSSSVSTCAYRLKVTLNSPNGYDVNIATDGNFRYGSAFIPNITSGTSVTAGVPRYGIQLDPGLATVGTVSRGPNFLVDDSPIGSGTNSLLYDSDGTNIPTTPDVTNTALVTHKASIDASVAAGNYNHLITYTVTANF